MHFSHDDDSNINMKQTCVTDFLLFMALTWLLNLNLLFTLERHIRMLDFTCGKVNGEYDFPGSNNHIDCFITMLEKKTSRIDPYYVFEEMWKGF